MTCVCRGGRSDEIEVWPTVLRKLGGLRQACELLFRATKLGIQIRKARVWSNSSVGRRAGATVIVRIVWGRPLQPEAPSASLLWKGFRQSVMGVISAGLRSQQKLLDVLV